MNITDAAKYVGRSVKTLQRLDREGVLIADRTTTNRRVYSIDRLNDFLGRRVEKVVPSRNVVYCRVSSNAQKPDLKNQKEALASFCIARGLSDIEMIEEIGGGLNFNRKKFQDIMDSVGRNEVKSLVIAHKDRLCRFGYDWFKHYCDLHGCEIIVLNQEKLSPEEEMTQDLMTIVHCFSSRLYGLRNYRKKLKEALVDDTSTQDTA